MSAAGGGGTPRTVKRQGRRVRALGDAFHRTIKWALRGLDEEAFARAFPSLPYYYIPVLHRAYQQVRAAAAGTGDLGGAASVAGWHCLQRLLCFATLPAPRTLHPRRCTMRASMLRQNSTPAWRRAACRTGCRT